MIFRLLLALSVVSLLLLPACVPVAPSKPARANAEYHFMMGVSALKENNPTEALKQLLQAEKFDSRNPEIQAALAQAYWVKQAHGLAEERFKRAIALGDNDPKYYNNLGALYLSMERYDDAIHCFQTAAENLLFDRPELAWTGIGLANVHKKDYPAAQHAYQKAMSINSRYYLAPFRLGELYYNQERPAEALDMFSRTVELAPTFPDGHYWLGLVYMKLKDRANAKKSFLEVVRLAPQSESAKLAGNYLKILGGK